MQSNLELEDIYSLVKIAGVTGFTGKYEELGGGEVNDSYKLDCGDRQVVLRVSKDQGLRTLENEAWALDLLNLTTVPRLIFFDKDKLVDGRLWILESYLSGKAQQHFSLSQFTSLGRLLAEVHGEAVASNDGVDLRAQFLDDCKNFGDEQFLLRHPDAQLQQLIERAYETYERQQPQFNLVKPTLTHLDLSQDNILVDGDDVHLIDWEFAKYNDPMADFATIYFEDIEYNRGKWRIKIEPDEKQALFAGYEAAGGQIDESRIKFWINHGKLTAAIFLYWRLHASRRVTNQQQTDQYRLDFDTIVASLLT